jgi:hypothetical protein
MAIDTDDVAKIVGVLVALYVVKNGILDSPSETQDVQSTTRVVGCQQCNHNGRRF